MLTLYHGRTSVCSIKARLALAEKGVAFESRLMTLRGDQFDPGYMKLNPNAVVPTLVHDGRVVIELTVVMHYVDEAFGGASFVPSDPLARAQCAHDGEAHGRITCTSSCMTITFATANRASLARAHAPRAGRRASPRRPIPYAPRSSGRSWPMGSTRRRWRKRLRQQEKLLDRIEAAMQHGAYHRRARTGRSRTPPRRLMSGGSTSSSSRGCGTRARASPPGISVSGNGHRSRLRWRTG